MAEDRDVKQVIKELHSIAKELERHSKYLHQSYLVQIRNLDAQLEVVEIYKRVMGNYEKEKTDADIPPTDSTYDPAEAGEEATTYALQRQYLQGNEGSEDPQQEASEDAEGEQEG